MSNRYQFFSLCLLVLTGLPGATRAAETFKAPKSGHSVVLLRVTQDSLVQEAESIFRDVIADEYPDQTIDEDKLADSARRWQSEHPGTDFNLVYGHQSGNEVAIVRNMEFVPDPQAGGGYFYLDVTPGKFYLYGVNLRGFWMIDWAANAPVFDVPPDTAAYLGTFDVNPSQATIFKLIHQQRMASRMQCRGGCAIEVQCNDVVHGFTPATDDEPGLNQAQKYVEHQLNESLTVTALKPLFEKFSAKPVSWTYPHWGCATDLAKEAVER